MQAGEADTAVDYSEPLNFTWIEELEDWRLEPGNSRVSHFPNTDIDWFLENQDLLTSEHSWNAKSPLTATVEPCFSPDGTITDVGGCKVDGVPPPIYLQESQSKLFVANHKDLPAPTCGFRICNALTDERRIELLMDLRDLVQIDLRDPIFSLNSMKQGIHLYARNVSIEYPFLHHETLFPCSEEIRQINIDVFGCEPGSQLIWAAITLGWTLMRSENNHEYETASKIQRALRPSIINHAALINVPPLWLVQALFLVLVFARYQGTREEYGFASVFHGVLLEAVRRLDYRAERNGIKFDPGTESNTVIWIKWIHAETIRRLVMQTFIADVKNAILHGGDVTMTPFELNLRLSFSEDAWYAKNHQDWAHFLRARSGEQVSFITMLKRSWNPQSFTQNPDKLPRGSKIIMYGLVSIAHELSRREDNSLSSRSNLSLLSLGRTVKQSLDQWEASWGKMTVRRGLQSYAWRNCTCVLRLSHTLYEIGPVDLQTVAGKEIIEGKRRGAADYAHSRRKIRQWAKQDRALLGVSFAAKVIQERLGGATSRTHCHHCLWCLYLAALICWNFGFALTGNTQTKDLIQDGQLISFDMAEIACHRYLSTVTMLQGHFSDIQAPILGQTAGVLVVVLEILKARCETGMIEESIELLARLVGVSG